VRDRAVDPQQRRHARLDRRQRARGCILNAPRPAAVYARSVLGHMLPDIVFGCLDQAIPDTFPAEGTSSLWNLSLVAAHGQDRATPRRSRHRSTTRPSTPAGVGGAGPQLDGLSANALSTAAIVKLSSSIVRNVPVEVTENVDSRPIVVRRKEICAPLRRRRQAGSSAAGLGPDSWKVQQPRGTSPMGIFPTASERR
jgi:N-methylhydantoinase B